MKEAFNGGFRKIISLQSADNTERLVGIKNAINNIIFTFVKLHIIGGDSQLMKHSDKSMKYSDTIFKNTDVQRKKSQIQKIQDKSYSLNSISLLKTKKDEYVKIITENPDFDIAFTNTYQITMSHGSIKEQTAMKLLESKHKNGDLEYDDIITLEDITNASYSHLFKLRPDTDINESIFVTSIGSLFVIGAIVIRFFYEVDNNIPLLIFLTIINLIAIAYTLFSYPVQVIKNSQQWLCSNNIQLVICKKILGKLSKKMWMLVSIIFVFLVVFLLICHFVFSNLTIGNDVISIIALGLSILHENIIQLLSIYHQRKIFNNKT